MEGVTPPGAGWSRIDVRRISRVFHVIKPNVGSHAKWSGDTLLEMIPNIIVKNGPLDGANLGVAGRSIEAINSNLRLSRWDKKRSEVVGDPGGGSTTNQCVVGGGMTRVVTVGVGASNSQGDG